MPVSNKHQDYDSNVDAWALVRDCVKGARAVKAKRTIYLPQPNASDKSAENRERYNDYLRRANYTNFTGSTKDGMLGMVFRKPIEVELPEPVEYMRDDFTGGGLTLDQMTRSLIGNVLEAGRYGVLVDYPDAPEGLTVAQVHALGLRANALGYRAEDIINWRTEMVGGTKKLTMVVLREPRQIESEDGFSVEEKIYHRVLLLIDGVYVQRIYNDKDELLGVDTGQTNESGEPIVSPDIIPTDAMGRQWNEIPFVFVGAQNNDELPDKSPLYDIAEINLGHYRNSADWEDSSYMVGQPTPYAAGLNQSWIDNVMKNGVVLGSRSFVLLPEGGSAGLIQAAPNQMPEIGMRDKEAQMVKLGARIIEDSGGNETAEAAKIRFAGQNSKLGTIVGNVESAIKQVIEWAMRFMGGAGEVTVEVNKQFYERTIDPQLLTAEIMLLDRGVIAKADMRDNLRRGGMINHGRTDEEIDAEAEETVMGV